jgi:hypothetical protein
MHSPANSSCKFSVFFINTQILRLKSIINETNIYFFNIYYLDIIIFVVENHISHEKIHSKLHYYFK